MSNISGISTDLFYKIRSRFTSLKLGDESGQMINDPSLAVYFDFDFVDDNVPLGHISISLAGKTSMKVYYSMNITDDMDELQKRNWYKFLKELRRFAKERLMTLDIRDISKDSLATKDFKYLSQQKQKQEMGESIVNESVHGTTKTSYHNLDDTILIIKHKKPISDELVPGARSRNIASIFIQNPEGERYKFPLLYLPGARAMQRHVKHGGLPYDDFGKHIIDLCSQIAQLNSFGKYVVRNDLINGSTHDIIEQGNSMLSNLRETISKLSKESFYQKYKEDFKGGDSLENPDENKITEYRDLFTVKNFNEDIADVFPILYKGMKSKTITYEDIVEMTSTNDESIPQSIPQSIQHEDHLSTFENWISSLGEDTDPLVSSDDERRELALRTLNQIMSEPLLVGVDGSNAENELQDVITDPELINQFKKISHKDSEQDVRDMVMKWIETKAPDIKDKVEYTAGESELASKEQSAEQPEYDKEQEQDRHSEEFDVKGFRSSQQGAEEPETPESRNEKDDDDDDDKPKKRKEKLTIEGLAEFILSFYDRENKVFPLGEEGVKTKVAKKFGDKAAKLSGQLIDKLSVSSKEKQDTELGLIKKLAGL